MDDPSPDPAPHRFWTVSERLGSLAGAGGLIVTLILYMFSWPVPVLTFLGGISLGVLLLSMVAHTVVSNSQPIESGSVFQNKPIPWHKPDPFSKVDISGLQELAAQPAIPAKANESIADAVEIGHLECHVWDEDAEEHLRGASIVALNEHTKREYSGTTNRDGVLILAVPCGYYSVTVKAERHLPRTDAVIVASINRKGFLQVSVQMNDSGRWVYNYDIRKKAVGELIELSKEGSALLKEAHAWNDGEAIRGKIDDWEGRAAKRVLELFGSAQETLFLSNSPLEIYEILSASAGLRNILNRVNTRVIRLNKLIERINADIGKMMPW